MRAKVVCVLFFFLSYSRVASVAVFSCGRSRLTVGFFLSALVNNAFCAEREAKGKCNGPLDNATPSVSKRHNFWPLTGARIYTAFLIAITKFRFFISLFIIIKYFFFFTFFNEKMFYVYKSKSKRKKIHSSY